MGLCPCVSRACKHSTMFFYERSITWSANIHLWSLPGVPPYPAPAYLPVPSMPLHAPIYPISLSLSCISLLLTTGWYCRPPGEQQLLLSEHKHRAWRLWMVLCTREILGCSTQALCKVSAVFTSVICSCSYFYNHYPLWHCIPLLYKFICPSF